MSVAFLLDPFVEYERSEDHTSHVVREESGDDGVDDAQA